MAQTARACSFLDRPWPLDDVISIPSDSESETDSDAEVMGQDVPRVHFTHDQHLDDSLPSISAIVASMVNVGHGPTKDVSEQLQTQLQGAMAISSLGSSTQDLCLGGEGESSDSSALNSPRGVIFVSRALDGPGIAADSNELVSPAIQQHNDGVNSVLPTSIPTPGVVSVASERRSAQSAPVLPPRDEALQEENVEPPFQPCLASTTIPVQHSQSQNCIVVSSNQCSQIHNVNVDHGRISGMVSRSDDELHSVARPASAQTTPSGCSRPVSRRGGLMEGVQKHQTADNTLPMDSRLSSSPTGQGWDEECQTSISANHTVSQPEEMEKRSSSRRGFRKAYNLRRLPVKRQLTAEQKDGGSNEKLVPQRKLRKLICPQPKKLGSQQGSGPRRNRKAHFLRKNTTKSSSNASVANAKRPAHSGVAGYEAWPLGNPVLKCTKQNGTVMFQLQFTSDTLWNTLAAQNDPIPKDGQAPNKVEDRRLRARKEQSNQQHAENIAQQSIQAAYPSVCPDIYRMDCLLARWRRHTFLVKWSDATTTWEPRGHIIDKGLLNRFEASWQGFDAGVDVLGARLRAGKLQRLLHWHGRPSKEDTWVRSELLSPQLMRRIQSNDIYGAHI
ncbi:uncharacterized protein G6M90_00g030600 [Metarhizium brunneum]|uniref:Chromo domain-containing protein n=1 Tax=Metarhizium brunneum TaxID=500148 RepID=A0A7D5UT87_9HYPO|nr:hypothetical protein G6M90_00g030600 [Metarhizium brunneum]